MLPMRPGHRILWVGLCIACWTGLAQQPSVPDAVRSAFGTPIAGATTGSTIAPNRAATPVEERVRTRIQELMSARRNRLGEFG